MMLRSLAKKLVFGVCFLLVSPLIIVAWVERQLFSGEAVFVGLSQLLSLFPGIVGNYLRGPFYWVSLNDCSWEVHIGFGTYFSHRTASLGKHVSIGSFCIIGTATIKDNVMLASRVSITSGKRQHFDDQMQISAQPRFDRVNIGSGSWIGEGAIVTADIGSNCIVSAGSVVIKAVPDGYIVGGNPGKLLKAVNEL